MDNYVTFALSAFTGIFAVTSPFANLPVFLGLVQGADKETRNRIASRAVLTGLIILITFILLGNIIFKVFGLTLPAFKITGGFLIFLTGLDMIRSRKSGVKQINKVNINEDIAISPLAIPILAGPGAIVTTMNYASNETWVHVIIVGLMVGAVMLLNYLAFKAGKIIIDRVGSNIISVISKIMGLIIGIIGMGMILQGLKLAFNVS